MLENTLQSRYIFLVLSALERFAQHGANVVCGNAFHLPTFIQSLAPFNAPVQRDDIVVALIAVEARDMALYFGGWSLDPLEENAAAESENTSYAAVKKDLRGRYPKHEWR
jgi:hypothetical protein